MKTKPPRSLIAPKNPPKCEAQVVLILCSMLTEPRQHLHVRPWFSSIHHSLNNQGQICPCSVSSRYTVYLGLLLMLSTHAQRVPMYPRELAAS